MGNRILQIIVLLAMLASSPGCLVIGTALLIRKIRHDRIEANQKSTAVDMQVQSSSDGVRSSRTNDGNDEQQAPLLPGGREPTCRDTANATIQEQTENNYYNPDQQ